MSAVSTYGWVEGSVVWGGCRALKAGLDLPLCRRLCEGRGMAGPKRTMPYGWIEGWVECGEC